MFVGQRIRRQRSAFHVVGTLAILSPTENHYSALMYAGTTMAVLLWWIAMIFPVMIVSRILL